MIPAAVEEFLRHDPPVPVIGRTATCPIQLQGAQVEAGDRVVLYLGAANRDPAVYAEPDEIMPDRFAGRSRPQPHLTFGTGIHRCPGAHLARLEMLVTIEEILDRLPGLSLPRSSAHAYTTGTSRGLTSLPITFELTRM
jgi:hypothetical protein